MDLMIFQWKFWCFCQVVPCECEILHCLPICMHQVNLSFYHPHTKIQYIFQLCQGQESISVLLHKAGWGYSFDAQTYFHRLFLCTLCIVQSASFEDPHLIISICQLQYPSENDSVYLQDKSSFHKIYIPFFWRTICLLLPIWIIIYIFFGFMIKLFLNFWSV